MRPFYRLALLVLLAFTFTACDSNESDRIVGGVDLDRLFAAPTAAEKATVLADWNARDVAARLGSVVQTDTASGGGRKFNVAIVLHTVAGTRQYGAILTPRSGTGTLPVVVYAHGGDGGTSVAEAATLAGTLSPPGQDFVWVVPAFRDEPLKWGSQTYQSEGPASPWDYDVDDALALLNVALEGPYRADADRIGVVGISRGGDVALLMAVRDSRVKRVLDLFGPTDFFGPYVQAIVEDALGGGDRALPGFDVLNARFIQPLRAGTVTPEQMRLELLRRSPVYFTDRLPAVQVQHGAADDVVDVSQSRRLASVMQGRPGFSYFEWAGGVHNPLSFPINWLAEAQTFLGAL